MHEPLLACAPALLFALLAAGCAGAPLATTPLVATPLLGPYPSRDDACQTLVKSMARQGWQSSTCSTTPIDLGAGALLGAGLILVKNGSSTDPRLSGTGSYFLGISAGAAWFLGDKPLDEVNGAAGHTYLPAVTAEPTAMVPHPGGALRVLFRLRDTTEAVCNACEGPEHDKRTPVETRRLVTVCGRLGSGKPECTPPLSVSVAAEVSLVDDLLTVAEPGKPRVRYTISF